jgi:pSer/pThr/pTyr-binding forkhead associated (FHA) protein
MKKSKSYKIGRSASSCDIVLADDTVSARHAELLITGDGNLFLTDTNSRHGTFILKKGQFVKIQQSYITPQDKLRFATCEISAKELLEYIHLKSLPTEPLQEKAEEIPKARGQYTQRCPYCLAVKEVDKPCHVCNH